MSHRISLLSLICLAFVVLPCNLFAQGGEIIKPPACCAPEPPPPPPGGDCLLLSSPADSMVGLTISDAELKELGMTRSQFLESLAANVLDVGTGQSYSLIIPIFTQIVTGDGSAAVQVDSMTIEAGKVDTEALNSFSLVFITDGKTTVAVLFTQTGGTE
jgi:hypothetical protein